MTSQVSCPEGSRWQPGGGGRPLRLRGPVPGGHPAATVDWAGTLLAEHAVASSRRAKAGSASAAKASSGRRAYLRREDRRAQLLERAAALVEGRGWAALSMSALAEAAGTSRQLIYLHFSNLEQLLAATAQHIFTDAIRDTRASLDAHPGDLHAAVRAAAAVTLDLPPGRADALWQLLAGTAAATPELEKMRRTIRGLIVDVWADPLQRELSLEAEEARTTAWILVVGFWGMRQLVRDGKISRARGMAVFEGIVQRLMPPAR